VRYSCCSFSRLDRYENSLTGVMAQNSETLWGPYRMIRPEPQAKNGPPHPYRSDCVQNSAGTAPFTPATIPNNRGFGGFRREIEPRWIMTYKAPEGFWGQPQPPNRHPLAFFPEQGPPTWSGSATWESRLPTAYQSHELVGLHRDSPHWPAGSGRGRPR